MLVAILVLALGPACSDDGGDTLADHPQVVRVIDAMLSRQAESLATNVYFTQIGCVSVQNGIGAPPLCEGDESHGDIVEVLPMAGCEGFYARPNSLDARFKGLSTAFGQPVFYGAYDGLKEGFPPGDTAVVFEVPLENQQVRAMAIYLTDGAVSGVHFGCSGSGASFVEFNRLGEPINAPLD